VLEAAERYHVYGRHTLMDAAGGIGGRPQHDYRQVEAAGG